ncbi:hypothetical protein F4809DRAFT_622562 [Biscogniauxia mediterranea]|nr:hypothetical protein F4809DRAFT_622562 [Biscogniauxia mediterranea]
MAAAALREGLGRGLSALGNAARTVAVRKPGSLEELKWFASQKIDQSEYRLAKSIQANVPHYDLSATRISDTEAVAQLQDEWYRVLESGPGVMVLQNFFTDKPCLERSNAVFDRIIEREAQSVKGDHFAASGANSRIWNSFQKHAESDPPSFARYYANAWLARVSEAWLGPNYQVTAQVNIVRPGGKPQSPHRDYHLGFQTAAACARFPRGAHVASQYLTLQGGVAHSDMPLESGPTRVLPFSQRLAEGYMAWREREFAGYFEENWVSVPMRAGDAVFFNPAVMHAAGENRSKDVDRSANLLQISSAFGRPMEQVNGVKVIRSCWEELKKLAREEGAGQGTAALVTAMADGYPFPSNLDKRQPGPDGMAPTSEVDVLWEGLKKDWNTDEVIAAVQQLRDDSSY